MGLPCPIPGSAMLRKLSGSGKRLEKINEQPFTSWSLAPPTLSNTIITENQEQGEWQSMAGDVHR